jgi:hypothetical protein
MLFGRSEQQLSVTMLEASKPGIRRRSTEMAMSSKDA